MKRAMALLFSVLLAASLCFTGCGGKQETKGGSGGGSAQATEKAAEKPAEDPIPGLYRVESFAGLGAEEIYEMMGAKNADEFRDSMTIELKEGGKGVANFDSDPSEITWKVENGVITMQDPGDASQTMTGEVKDGVMKLTIEGESIYMAKKGSEKAALEMAAASGETSELAEMFQEMKDLESQADNIAEQGKEAVDKAASQGQEAIDKAATDGKAAIDKALEEGQKVVEQADGTAAGAVEKASGIAAGAAAGAAGAAEAAGKAADKLLGGSDAKSGELGKYVIYEYEAGGQKVSHDLLVQSGMGDTYLELKEGGKAELYLFNQAVDATWEPGVVTVYGTSKYTYELDGDMLILDMAGVTYYMLKDGSAPASTAGASGKTEKAETKETAAASGGSGAAALDSEFDLHGLYTVQYSSDVFRTADSSEFGDLVNKETENKVYITTLDGDMVKDKTDVLNGTSGAEKETFTVDGHEATVWVYEDWLGYQCDMIIPMESEVKSDEGWDMDAVYIYAGGDTKEDVYNDDILAIMKSVKITGKAGEKKAEETTAAETTAAAAAEGPADMPAGDGIIPDEQVKKGYVYLDKILGSKAFDMTYDDLVAYFGAPGLFKGEEYSDHMKCNYRYFDWVSDKNQNTFIHVNLKEDADGKYTVSGFNSSGFTGSQAADEFLEELKAEEKEKSKAAAATMPMKDVVLEVYPFGSKDKAMNVKVQIPEKEWIEESKNGTGKIYNCEDLNKTFGVGFIQIKTDKELAKFDFYKDKFENYKEIDSRTIGGIEMQGRTYKNIGYEWTEYIGEVKEGCAVSIGIVRVDTDEGTIGGKIIDSISFE